MEQSVTINNDVCRCCATQGTFKNIRSQYQWMGEEEIYADMIRECFNITLCLSESCLEEGICEVCITQLRNASNFKRQVLQTEEQFKRKIEGVITVEVKLEDESQPDGKFIDSDTELHEAFGDDFLEDDYPLSTIKEESKPKLETKAKKRSAKTVKTKTKKTKTEEGETSTKRPAVKTLKKETTRMYTEQFVLLKKQYENLKIFLENSNATPIKRLGILYQCSFCGQQYETPSEVKQHTIQEHEDSKHLYLAYEKSFRSFLAKLDITDLTCKLCFEKLHNLGELAEHLNFTHEIFIHNDAFENSQILEFNFESNPMKCVHCTNTYDSFISLICHMHKHYSNFQCDECDQAFANQTCLQNHLQTHKRGTYTCEVCGKVFDNKNKKKNHVSSHHNSNLRWVCPYCEQKFPSQRTRLVHLRTVHNKMTEKFFCQACDKVFLFKSDLTKHYKTFHLLESKTRMQCEECSLVFGSKVELNLHKDDAKYQCGECDAKFCTLERVKIHLVAHSKKLINVKVK